MSPSAIKELLIKAWAHQRTVLLKGPPGVGKTEMIKQSAAAGGYALWIAHPALSESVDFKGFPVAGISPEGNRWVEFLPDIFLDHLRTTKVKTIAFLDDLGQSAQTVQAAVMQFIQERRLNGHRISDEVIFCGATNEVQDLAGANALIEPLKGRWDTIIKAEVSWDDWRLWAFDNDMPDVVIAFLQSRPSLLHDFKPTRSLERSPDPRAWEKAGRWINENTTTTEVLEGCIGKGAAAELANFIFLADKLPDIQKIIDDPDHGVMPEEISLQYLISTALARKCNANNIGRIMRYLNRLNQALRVQCLKDATHFNLNVAMTKEYVTWAKGEGASLIT